MGNHSKTEKVTKADKADKAAKTEQVEKRDKTEKRDKRKKITPNPKEATKLKSEKKANIDKPNVLSIVLVGCTCMDLLDGVLDELNLNSLHQSLLAIFDSILALEKGTNVFLVTPSGGVIEINPQMRIPRSVALLAKVLRNFRRSGDGCYRAVMDEVDVDDDTDHSKSSHQDLVLMRYHPTVEKSPIKELLKNCPSIVCRYSGSSCEMPLCKYDENPLSRRASVAFVPLSTKALSTLPPGLKSIVSDSKLMAISEFEVKTANIVSRLCHWGLSTPI